MSEYELELSPVEAVPKKFEVSMVFQNSQADLIVTSQDGIKFRVYKAFLAEGSTFFHNMFKDSHPDSPAPSLSATQSEYNDTTVVHLPWDADARIIDRLLTYIYPIVNPNLEEETLEGVIELIRAADKWQVDIALHYLKEELVSPRFLNRRPLRVFAFSRELGFEAEWKMACRKSLEIDIRSLYVRDDLVGMSAKDFASLLDLREGRISNATTLLKAASLTCHHGNPLGSYDCRESYKAFALDELSRRPLSKVLGPDSAVTAWLFAVAPARGHRCCNKDESYPVVESILHELRRAIDALPDTI